MSATPTRSNEMSAGNSPTGPIVTHARWTLGLTSIGIFMVILDALVVVTALPLIRRDVGGDVSSLQWILSAYLLSFGAGIITASSLGDRFGRRRLFVVGLVLFAAASGACALAPSILWLVFARAIQGVGAAIVTPISLSLLMASFPPERRGTVLGIWGGIGGVAVAAGPLVGGAVTQGLNWHWIFWINVPIGLVAALLSARLLTESGGSDSRLDLEGAVLITSASSALLWGLVRGAVVGWGSLEVLGTLGMGSVLLAFFVAWERRAPAPMLPLQYFRTRTFSAANAVGFLSLGSLLSAAFFMSQYFQLVLGYSPFDAGLRFLPWTAVPLVVAPLAGRFADRIGPRPLMVLGLILQAGGLAAVIAVASPTVSYAALALPLTIGGVGISMVLPAAPLAAFGSVPRADIGKASGVYNSMQRFGGAFVIAFASAAFVASGQLGGSAAGFMSGFRSAIGVSVALSLLGAAIALGVSRRQLQGGPDSGPRRAAARSPSM